MVRYTHDCPSVFFNTAAYQGARARKFRVHVYFSGSYFQAVRGWFNCEGQFKTMPEHVGLNMSNIS
jgi:hypothetical protein